MKRIVRSKIIIIFGIIVALLLAATLVVLFLFFTPKDRSVLFGAAKSFEYQGQSRQYRLVEPTQKVSKIIVGLHGFSDSSRRFAYYTGLHNVSDENTLVVYPQASEPKTEDIKRGWNAGFCCGSGAVGSVDDTGFLLALIKELEQKYSSGDTQVFVTGFSNGAFMAQRLAAEHPGSISALAASSGSIGTDERRLEPKAAVPILLLHGEKDTIVPFDGGVGSSDPDFSWLSFQDTLETWQSINGSETETKTIVYPNDGHKWHGWRILNFWNKTPDASEEMLTFFSSQSRHK